MVFTFRKQEIKTFHKMGKIKTRKISWEKTRKRKKNTNEHKKYVHLRKKFLNGIKTLKCFKNVSKLFLKGIENLIKNRIFIYIIFSRFFVMKFYCSYYFVYFRYTNILFKLSELFLIKKTNFHFLR